MPSRVTSASSGTRRPTSISVARSSQPDCGGGELHAGQRLDRAASRGDPADRLQLRQQHVALEGDLHDEYLREGIRSHRGMKSCGEVRDRSQIAAKLLLCGGQASLSTVAVGLQPRTSRSTASELAGGVLIIATRSETRLQACSTVAWLRPPKASPMACSGAPVSSRARWMAIWRGQATRAVRPARRARRRDRRVTCAATDHLDVVDRSAGARAADRIHGVHDLGGQLEVERSPGQGVEGHHSDQRALERPDVGR